MISNVGAARPAYFDRNPVSKTTLYSAAAVAPHALVVRASYTVPAGKKAFLQSAISRVLRQAAAAPVGIVICLVYVTPLAGSNAEVGLARLRTNVVGDKDAVNYAGAGVLVAGEVVNTLTEDTSTGGGIDYHAAAWLAEYDA